MRFIALLIFSLPLFAQPFSFRVGFGAEATRGTTLADADCTSTNPPALFGCVDGNDAKPLAARGDFGTNDLLELGAAYDLGTNARIELLLARRDGLELDARTNFPNVTGDQPVSANAKSTAAFLAGTWLFGASPDVRPFVTAGAGASRNEIDAITFAFPGIVPDAVTIIRGGSHTGFAYLLGAGVSVSMGRRLDLELAVRYTDLGAIETDDGAATIVRPRGVTTIDIAGTEGELESVGVVASVRYRLR